MTGYEKSGKSPVRWITYAGWREYPSSMVPPPESFHSSVCGNGSSRRSPLVTTNVVVSSTKKLSYYLPLIVRHRSGGFRDTWFPLFVGFSGTLVVTLTQRILNQTIR